MSNASRLSVGSALNARQLSIVLLDSVLQPNKVNKTRVTVNIRMTIQAKNCCCKEPQVRGNLDYGQVDILLVVELAR